MDYLIDLFDTIFTMVETAFNFLGNLVSNLGMLIQYIGIASTTANNLVVSLPTWLQTFGTVTILISVLYLILGRSTGGDKSD